MSGNQGPASLCHLVLSDAEVPAQKLQFLTDILNYRLDRIITLATTYKNKLKLQNTFPDCKDFDILKYRREHASDKTKMARYSVIFSRITACNLFLEPSDSEGLEYAKGIEYLTAAMTEEGWNDDQIQDGLDALKVHSSIPFP
jgi:hypothetical protein